MKRRFVAQPYHDAGFSLVEAIIATALVASALVAVAELFAIAVKNGASARFGTFASVLAAQKMEQLRDSRRLMPSATNTLQSNSDGYVDFLGPTGAELGSAGSTVPDGTIYIRRWSVESVQGSSAYLLQVLVTRRRNRGAADLGAVARAPEEARLITLVRQAP